MKQYHFYLLILALIHLSFGQQTEKSNDETGKLLINHLGYETTGSKTVVFQTHRNTAPGSFSILDAVGNVVFEGTYEPGGAIAEWHTGSGWAGDFSALEQTGRFRVSTAYENSVYESDYFTIGDQLLARETFGLLISGIRSQRTVGIYNEKDKRMTFYGDRTDTVDVSGGWYDASGDRSKYLSHLSYANYMNPQQSPMVIWNFLEAHNHADTYQGEDRETVKKNLLEEAVYGADWLVRMQDEKGYFYMNVFDNWSWDPEKREISAYIGQEGYKNDRYQSGFREGGGMSVAALARTAGHGLGGEYTTDTYLAAAVKGFEHLQEKNLDYIEDGEENIIDDYCALMAASELFFATSDQKYLQYARVRMQNLAGRIEDDEKVKGYWRADRENVRPYFHAAEAGLPVISLARYLDLETDPAYREVAITAIRRSVDFELMITNEVNNPFGYARQYVKAVDEPEKRTAFFIPKINETGYWWQGENARLGSIAAAMHKAIPYIDDTRVKPAFRHAANQINWILGLNPYNMSMLDGRGHNNPKYSESGRQLNVEGCVSNGITSGFDNENDIAFSPAPYGTNPSHSWRWGEQWLPHGSWLIMAIATSLQQDMK